MLVQVECFEQVMECQCYEIDQVVIVINEMFVVVYEVVQSVQCVVEVVQQIDYEGQVVKCVVDGSIECIYVLVDEICDSGIFLDSLQQDV